MTSSKTNITGMQKNERKVYQQKEPEIIQMIELAKNDIMQLL